MRSVKYFLALASVVCMIGLTSVGCDDGNTEKKDVGKKGASHDEHHTHIHGPMGGEVIEIDGVDFKLEVVAKYGQDLVAIAFYKDDLKTPHKIACEKLTARIPAMKDKEFMLAGVNTEDGMASKFEIEDQDFAIARKTTGFKLEFEVDGKKHMVDIPKDPHG